MAVNTKKLEDALLAIVNIKTEIEREGREEESKLRTDMRHLVEEIEELKLEKARLTAEKAAFAAQMKFTTDRFDKEVGYLKSLMEQILLRLPTVSVDRVIETNGHREKEKVEA